MDILLQQLLNGLVLGAIYALVALGYTMVYGILELINFAHGEVTMMGAMIAIAAMTTVLGFSPGLHPASALAAGLAAAIPACVLLGLAIERIAYRPLRHAPRLAPLITAIGVSIVLQNVAMMIWGRQYISFPEILPATPHDFGGVTITTLQIGIVALSVACMLALTLFVNRTRFGRAMRATAQSAEMAGLMGIDANRIVMLAFAIGAALAAIAGIMVSAYYGLAHYTMGFTLGLKAFSAAVLGGIGNLPGAMLGGFAIGIIESLGAGYIGPLTGGVLGSHYQDIFAFLVLILVLVLRPTGLLGERVADRA